MALGDVYEVAGYDHELGDILCTVSTDATAMMADVMLGGRVQEGAFTDDLRQRLDSAAVADLGGVFSPGDYSAHQPGEELGWREQSREFGLNEFRAHVVGTRISMSLTQQRVSAEMAFRMSEILNVLVIELGI
jgi:hypothetical protein